MPLKDPEARRKWQQEYYLANKERYQRAFRKCRIDKAYDNVAVTHPKCSQAKNSRLLTELPINAHVGGAKGVV